MKNNITYKLLILFALLILWGCKKNVVTNSIETSTVKDIQGNSYKTIKIGNQWWMAENLKVTVFNDSSKILNIDTKANDSVWAKQLNPAYCVVDTSFGALYNWFVVNNTKSIAPKGWHIPTDEEWKTLEKTLGMTDEEVAKTAWRGTNEAEKLIVEASKGWQVPTIAFGLNTYGFSAFPSGCRVFNGSINSEKNTAFWWTSTPENSEAWYRYIDGQQKQIFRQHTYKQYGFSIRCVKD